MFGDSRHFVLLQHGVLGTSADFNGLLRQIIHISDTGASAFCADQTTTGGGRLLVRGPLTCLATGSNAHVRSLQGTLRCARRALRECIFHLRNWLDAGNGSAGAVLSCVGHSFGGIVARELLFLLLVATEDAEFGGETQLRRDTMAVRALFTERRVSFANFVTIATPHCGAWNGLWAPLRALVLRAARIARCATLTELMLDTDTREEREGETKGGEGKEGIGQGPLLARRLVQDKHREALRQFHRRTVFANVRKDMCVGFATATLRCGDVDFGSDDSVFSAPLKLRPTGRIRNTGSTVADGHMESSEAIAAALRSDLEWRAVALRYAGVVPVAHVACIGMLSWCGAAQAEVRRIAQEIVATHTTDSEVSLGGWMLGELPPIVSLPQQPAELLRPVPVFVRGVGLYARQHSDATPGASPNPISIPKPLSNTKPMCSSLPPRPPSPGSNSKSNINNNGRSSSSSSSSSSSACGSEPCAVTEREVDVLLDVLESRLAAYREAKQRTTEEYLARIESTVDRFLSEQRPNNNNENENNDNNDRDNDKKKKKKKNGGGGWFGVASLLAGAAQGSAYTPNAIPFDYLDARPANMAAIHSNLAVIRAALTGPSVFRARLVDPLVAAVWARHLRPLETRAQELLAAAQNNVRPPLRYLRRQRTQKEGKGTQGEGKGEQDGNYYGDWAQRRARYARVVKALRDDLAYLRIIREMDVPGADAAAAAAKPAGGAGPSDYVPVSGLVLSRLHRLENEHRTVAEFWQSR